MKCVCVHVCMRCLVCVHIITYTFWLREILCVCMVHCIILSCPSEMYACLSIRRQQQLHLHPRLVHHCLHLHHCNHSNPRLSKLRSQKKGGVCSLLLLHVIPPLPEILSRFIVTNTQDGGFKFC